MGGNMDSSHGVHHRRITSLMCPVGGFVGPVGVGEGLPAPDQGDEVVVGKPLGGIDELVGHDPQQVTTAWIGEGPSELACLGQAEVAIGKGSGHGGDPACELGGAHPVPGLRR